MLTIRTTRIPTASGVPPADDYEVLESGKVVGRIMKRAVAGNCFEWLWAIHARDAPPYPRDRGQVPTLEEAKAALKAAWVNRTVGLMPGASF